MPIVSNTLKLLLFTLVLAGCLSAQGDLPDLVKRIKPSSVAIETFDAKGNTLSRGSGFFIAPDRPNRPAGRRIDRCCRKSVRSRRQRFKRYRLGGSRDLGVRKDHPNYG